MIIKDNGKVRGFAWDNGMLAWVPARQFLIGFGVDMADQTISLWLGRGALALHWWR